ncbi:transcription factor [Colletotrichum sojae]|uniref:Transcription factor n=1 Tax=Colletotrichum sojae TaxID=2175907 RepID=A0A8H6MSJ3_9PEZI|nr:transcription factor [Colletotrichum sojae]
MPLAQRRSNVRRSNVTACHRCKSRKQRCDQSVPTCSNCERAGVECVGTDIDGRVAPRSYIKSLEDRVAYLETQLMSHGIHDQQNDTPGSTDFSALVNHAVSHSPPSQGHSNQPQPEEDLVGQIVLNSLRPHHFPTAIANHNGLSLLNSLLSGPMTKVSRPGLGPDHRTLFDELPYEARVDMPRGEAANHLIDIYFEHCNFFSPILPSKARLTAMLSPLYSPPPDPPTAAFLKAKFRASMIFAISILLVNRTDPSAPAERSEVYFHAATSLLAQDPSAVCTGDLDHLTDLLLVVQYCCFRPNLTAAWHFLGLATRLAVELDLHSERPRHGPAPDPVLVEERRWLFWAAYTFERNLCVILGRPFSIPDEAIDTPLPSPPPLDDPSRAQALHLIKLRRFESEIYVTLRQNRPPDGTPLDAPGWRAGIIRRLAEWHASVPASHHTQLTPQQVFDGMYHNCMVNLHYPSPRFPDPTADDVLALARHAAASITCYKQSFRSRELRFYWRTVHSLFRSGVALVYCVRAAALLRVVELDVPAAVDAVNSCSSILWAMVERYPQGQAYRDIFESLVGSVLGKDGGGPDVLPQQQPPLEEQPGLFESLFAASEDADLPFTATDALSWGFAQTSPAG